MLFVAPSLGGARIHDVRTPRDAYRRRSMSGYTPVFNTVLDGTLYGKWPHTGIWVCLLSQVDKHGNIDMVPALLAAKIGVSVEILIQTIHDFMEPDPGSRTKVADGRRLELIDPAARDWGWRVINHEVYRQRARSKEQVADGRNAAKVKRYKERHHKTPVDTSRHPSYSDADTNTNTNKDTRSRLQSRPVSPSFHEEVISAYHELLPSLPTVKVWNKSRKQALDARIRERCADGKPADRLQYWRGFFENVAASDFLSGRSGKFTASLEWLLQPSNFLKVIEGNYVNRHVGSGAR